jgi:hypothetical protein
MGSAENKCLGGLRQFVNGRFISVKLIERRIKKNYNENQRVGLSCRNKFEFNFLFFATERSNFPLFVGKIQTMDADIIFIWKEMAASSMKKR